MRLILFNLLVPLVTIFFAINYSTSFYMFVAIVPLVLLIINIYLIRAGIERSWAKCCFLMFLGLALAQLISYFMQSFGKGDMFNPDAETVHLNLLLAKYYAFLAFSFFTLGKGYGILIKYLHKKNP